MNPSTTPDKSSVRAGEYRVPIQAPPGECRSCHAPVLWATSEIGKAIPLSVSTIHTDETGQRWALTHFADCPNAAQHRSQTAPGQVVQDLCDLPDYLERHGLVVVGSTMTDDGNGKLLITLQTRKQ